MIVGYSNAKTHKLCTDAKTAKKELGDKVAINLFKRLSWLGAADNLAIFNGTFNCLRLHKLKGKYSKYYAIDITKGYRLIFYPCSEDGILIENANFETITVVTIEEVNNHYDD